MPLTKADPGALHDRHLGLDVGRPPPGLGPPQHLERQRQEGGAQEHHEEDHRPRGRPVPAWHPPRRRRTARGPGAGPARPARRAPGPPGRQSRGHRADGVGPDRQPSPLLVEADGGELRRSDGEQGGCGVEHGIPLHGAPRRHLPGTPPQEAGGHGPIVGPSPARGRADPETGAAAL